jgi:predicted ABC-type sugar transport system permease subunit
MQYLLDALVFKVLGGNSVLGGVEGIFVVLRFFA